MKESNNGGMLRGDRIEHAILEMFGTVEYIDSYHVRVKWDVDGKIGLLYFDGSTIANAKHLLLLQPASSSGRTASL